MVEVLIWRTSSSISSASSAPPVLGGNLLTPTHSLLPCCAGPAVAQGRAPLSRKPSRLHGRQPVGSARRRAHLNARGDAQMCSVAGGGEARLADAMAAEEGRRARGWAVAPYGKMHRLAVSTRLGALAHHELFLVTLQRSARRTLYAACTLHGARCTLHACCTRNTGCHALPVGCCAVQSCTARSSSRRSRSNAPHRCLCTCTTQHRQDRDRRRVCGGV